MIYQGFRVDIDDTVAVITMCQGDNKFTMDYVREWHRVLDDVERNPKISGLITRGDGRSFSTGLDPEWMKKQTPATLDRYHDELHSLYKRIVSLGMTTVAVLNGYAIAEGAFIALMHDYRVMRSDRGWIQWPEVHLKLPFTRTMIDVFRVKVSSGRAHREALVFGKRLNAVAAKDLGIVDVVSTEVNLMTEARRMINLAVGKMELTRGFLTDMKSDIYNNYVTDEKLFAKM